MLLGVNYSGMHDAAVALLTETGELVSAVSEERLSRVKKDGRLPRRALDAVPWNDVDEIVVPYLADLPPFLGRDRLVDDLLIHTDRPVPPYPPKWRQQIESLPRPISYVDHHEAHAYAGFHLSGFTEALAITCDSGAYNCDSSLGVFHVNREGVSRLHAASFFCYESICRLYSDVTALLGFQPCVHEGKVTGLAAQGVPSQACRDAVWDIHQQIRAHRLPLCMWVGFLDEEVPAFVDVNEFLRRRWRRALDYPDADVARAAQDIFEGALLTIVERVAAEHGKSLPLVLSGGGFANVKLNMEIAALGFPAVSVCPPMGDEGLAVGAPALRLAQARRRPAGGTPAPATMFLGPDCDAAAAAGIAQASVKASRVPDVVAAVVDCLADSKVVAIARGRAEFGPRALGNRSVLFHAGDPTVNDWLNHKLDRTEFMPFAPVLRVENAHRSFEEPEVVVCSQTASFMTVCMRARPEFTTVHPAVVHIDGTARPQLVSHECQPFLWEVLRRYEQLTGAWALINTSFNMHEEPIVCAVDDALSAFFAAGLDVLVLGDWVITRDANADVAKGAALTRRGRHQERLRRAAQSASLGRLLHDLVAANDGVTVRHLDPDLYRGSRDQTSPDTGESGSGTHPSTSHMWEAPPQEGDRAMRGAGSIPAVKRVRPPLSPDWSPHV
jgi:carbamoyltransferase